MARVYATPWHRHKYLLNAWVLILPLYFLYQSLSPEFPPVLREQTLGQYTVAPMPFDTKGAYEHDGEFVKDFLVTFKQGEIDQIRQAHMNIASSATPIEVIRERNAEEGILHGSRHGQHVHALAKETFEHGDRIWLTIENWDGSVVQTSWELPVEYLSKR